MRNVSGLLLILATSVLADDGPVGSGACRSCHSRQYATQSASHHAKALLPIIETALPALLGKAAIQERSGLVFEYRQQRANLDVTVQRGGESLTAPLLWAFGSGSQAHTPVGMRNGRYFEHRVSYYTSASRPGRTLGHPGEASRSLESALGIAQDAETIFRCFNCHATGVKPGPDLTKMRVGVTCERCHGSGGAHIMAAQSATPEKVRKTTAGRVGLPARELVLFCAECHRSPQPNTQTAAPEKSDPLSIRFQPVGLLASRCFQKSETLSCISCHSPHENARREDQFYVEKCLGCHAAGGPSPQNCGLTKQQNCLPCHMQKRSPAEFLTFTDHRIRVYR